MTLPEPPAAGSAIRRRVVISGRVQLVGFRAFAKFHAGRHSLMGWVRNTERGEVEVLVQGEVPAVEAFLKLLERGPSAAVVSNFTVSEETVGTELGEFAEVA